MHPALAVPVEQAPARARPALPPKTAYCVRACVNTEKFCPAPFAGPVLANANKPLPGTTTCAGRPSFARGGGSRRQLDLSAHTWRWARCGKKRREMPHVHQGSYGPPGADNMPRTAGAKRPTAALACLQRERPQRRNRSARRCARRMRSSLNLSFAQPGASPACLLYTSPSPRDLSTSRMPSSA